MNTTEYLKEKLINPPEDKRPVQIIHNYYPVKDSEINAYLDNALKNNMGGFCINMDIRPQQKDGESEEEYRERFLNAYLSEDTDEAKEKWEGLVKFVDGCFDRNMKVWIYDERGFPSGCACRHVTDEMPDARVKGLICVTDTSKDGKLSIKKDRGTLYYVAAYPEADGKLLTSKAIFPANDSGDEFVFDVPDDGYTYRAAALYARPVEFFSTNAVYCVDLMRADVTDCYIKNTHEKYLKYLGPERMSKIVAFFTDEPGLPVHGCASVFREKDAVAAWTEEMDGIIPYEAYVDIFFETDRGSGAARRIWWGKAAELFAKNYFGRIGKWCEEHGTRMTGHLYGEETLSMQIGLNGDLFGLMRYETAPGVDRLYCTNPRDVTAEKTASSAAHMYGKDMTMSENSFHLERVFWDMKDHVTPENRINSDFYQKQLGITNIASYFDYPAGTAEPDRQDYELRSGRASTFITAGTHKTDVLVLIPMEGAHTRFAPPDHKYWLIGPCTVAPYQPESIQKLEYSYGEALLRLEDGLYDFDLTDAIGLDECTVADGKISTKFESFKNLVVFNGDVFTESNKEKIREFVKCGGFVTAAETELDSDIVTELKEKYPSQIRVCAPEKICENLPGAEKLLDIELPEDSGVRIRKSETDDCNLWFVHNRKENDAEFALPEGNYTVFSTEGRFSEHAAGDVLTVKSKDALMIVREK